MAKLGNVSVLFVIQPAAVSVFDDGILLVPGVKLGRLSLLLLGAFGLIVRPFATRGLRKRLAALEALQPGDLTSAAAVAGTTAIPAQDITEVHLKKPPNGAQRYLIIHRSSGRNIDLQFDSKKEPTARLAALLAPVVGDRLRVDDGA